MQNNNKVDSAGAAFLAVNGYGWAIAPSPWAAFAKLDLTGGRTPTVGSTRWVDATNYVSLYYLPCEETFAGLRYYAPVDVNGAPYGVPLYCGEHNAAAVKDLLTRAATPPDEAP